MLGAAFALISAFSLSLNSISVRRGVVTSTPAQGLYVTVILGVPLFALAALVTGQLMRIGQLAPMGFLALAVAGVIHFAVGRYSNYRAIQCIGAVRTGPIMGLVGPYSLLLAIFLLDEVVRPLMGLAIVLILAGPIVMTERRRGGPRPSAMPSPSTTPAADTILVPGAASAAVATAAPPAQPAFVLRQAEGYFFSLLGALCFGTSPLLVRWALADSGLGIAGGTISYAAAAVVLLLTLLLPGRYANLRRLERGAGKFFATATITSFLHQMFRYLALSIAPVTVVNPLNQTTGVFTLALSWLFNRRLEYFTTRMLIGVVLSVTGSVMLALQL